MVFLQETAVPWREQSGRRVKEMSLQDARVIIIHQTDGGGAGATSGGRRGVGATY